MSPAVLHMTYRVEPICIEKTRDNRDGTNQCPVFTDTQPGRDCPVFSTRKHGTAGNGQSNAPYLQTHSRDGTVPCFQRENTRQPGRDNPMSRIYRHTAGTGLSRVFNEKTRDSRDGTIQCPVFSDTQPGRDIGLSRPGYPVFSTRKHGTAGTGRNFFLVPSRPGVPDFSIELQQ